MLHAGASLASFYNMDDPKTIEHFDDKFFDRVEHVFATSHRDYAEKFFVNLSPAFLCRTKYKARYEKVLERVKQTDNTHFIHLLQDEIESLEEMMFVRQ